MIVIPWQNNASSVSVNLLAKKRNQAKKQNHYIHTYFCNKNFLFSLFNVKKFYLFVTKSVCAKFAFGKKLNFLGGRATNNTTRSPHNEYEQHETN